MVQTDVPSTVENPNDQQQEEQIVQPTVAVEPPTKVPKIKHRKYQSIGHEMIRLFTMVMHKQKEVMGLKILPETQKKEKVDLTNAQRINLLQNYNFQFNRD